MKVIIAGSRKMEIYTDELDKIITDSGFEVDEVVSGGAAGVDTSAIQWAHQFGIPLVVMPALWNAGAKAGPMRNARMAEYADALILIWDGKSKGSKSMLVEAKKRVLPVYQVFATTDGNGNLVGLEEE